MKVYLVHWIKCLIIDNCLFCEKPLAIDLVLYFSTLSSAACLSVSCRVCQAQTGLLWPIAMSLGISTGTTGSTVSMVIFLWTTEEEEGTVSLSQLV
jgi:hypothetical protein